MKPWFLVSTNVCRHYGSSLDLQGPQCRAGVLVLSLIGSWCNGGYSGVHKCLSTPGWTLCTSMSPTPHQYLLSTSPAPPQHLPSTSPAPPQHLPSTCPPTQHLGMLRAVKSTCMLGAHMQAANLPGKTRGTEKRIKIKSLLIGQIRTSLR